VRKSGLLKFWTTTSLKPDENKFQTHSAARCIVRVVLPLYICFLNNTQVYDPLSANTLSINITPEAKVICIVDFI